jgi:hypothetical protein
VLSAVESALKGSAVSGNFQAQDLTEKIILELRPFVEEGVRYWRNPVFTFFKEHRVKSKLEI